QARMAKDFKELKAKLSSLSAKGAGGDFSFAQILCFLKQHNIDSETIAKVEEAKVRELESKPPTALAARHRVENAKRQVEKLEERVQQYEEQSISRAPRTPSPSDVGTAGLDPAVMASGEGKAALETLQRLQREAKEAADRAAAATSQPPGWADGGAGGGGSGGPREPKPPGAPVPSAADYEDENSQAGLKRAMESENSQQEVAKYLAEHQAKKQPAAGFEPHEAVNVFGCLRRSASGRPTSWTSSGQTSASPFLSNKPIDVFESARECPAEATTVAGDVQFFGLGASAAPRGSSSSSSAAATAGLDGQEHLFERQ
ncbi:unnamed protein product, partial [Prorocentrum cordatum]